MRQPVVLRTARQAFAELDERLQFPSSAKTKVTNEVDVTKAFDEPEMEED